MTIPATALDVFVGGTRSAEMERRLTLSADVSGLPKSQD